LIFNDAGAYLIVGGLKGLCGSLAVFLARHGVKHIVLLSRSGYDDSKSRKVLADLSSLGAHVDLVQGDVTLIADVRRTFAHASVPICGIIQGAMVLRVSSPVKPQLQNI
jgi:NAD(P)-dependent dehydrogenase (short-subunit alcohol dehydrogenase family)